MGLRAGSVLGRTFDNTSAAKALNDLAIKADHLACPISHRVVSNMVANAGRREAAVGVSRTERHLRQHMAEHGYPKPMAELTRREGAFKDPFSTATTLREMLAVEQPKSLLAAQEEIAALAMEVLAVLSGRLPNAYGARGGIPVTQMPPKPTLAMFAAPVGRPAASARDLPRAPEVDEVALGRAEAELEPAASRTAPPAPYAPAASPTSAPRRSRRRCGRPATDVIFIEGPKPMIDAFKEREQFRGSWQALEELLIAHGVEIEDFDG